MYCLIGRLVPNLQPHPLKLQKRSVFFKKTEDIPAFIIFNF